MEKYDDIINCSRPKSDRIPMAVADRAKIFMPFAALKGYDEAVDDKKKLYTKRIELTEERKEELDRQMCLFKNSITKGDKLEVCIKYFEVDERASMEKKEEVGKYIDIIGEVSKVDEYKRRIKINDKYVGMEDILEIQCEKAEKKQEIQI